MRAPLEVPAEGSIESCHGLLPFLDLHVSITLLVRDSEFTSSSGGPPPSSLASSDPYATASAHASAAIVHDHAGAAVLAGTGAREGAGA